MANLNLSEFGEKLFVADADHTFIWDTENAISKRVSRNSWLNSGTLTSDAPVTISQTWGTTGTYTATKINVTETATATSASRLLDLQVGGVSLANFSKAGHLIFPSSSTVTPSGPGVGQWVGTLALFGTGGSLLVTGSGGGLNISGNILLSWNNDTILLRGGAANLQLGAADAAAPVAQTLSVQSVVAGTTNTAGAAFTIDGSQGTGTGAGGALIFRTAPAGSSGSTQNALATAMLITADSRVVPTRITIDGNLGPIEIFNDLATAQGRTFPARSATISRQGICYRADAQMAWSPGNGSTVDGGNFGTADTILVRDGVGTLALRNGTSAQTFRIYNTTDTGVTTYERAALGFSSNVFRIVTENLAGVTAPRDICLNSGTGTTQIAGNGISTLMSFPISFGGTNTGTLGYTGGAFRVGTVLASPCDFLTSNLVRVRINDAGNVGIGTTSPTSKLQVSAGDVEVDTIAKGVILKSPDGTRYRVTVANGGTLSVAAV